MQTAIIGTGGVGGYFGAKLAKAGYAVSFLARGEHLKAIQQKGITVKSIHGDFTVESVHVTDKITKMGNPDVILLAVKSWQVKELSHAIRSILKENTVIIPLQNGVLAAEDLCETIDKKHVVGGLCRIFSKIEAPGIINHFGATPSIVFGELDKTRTERLEKIGDIFEKAGFKGMVSADIEADLWKKFIAICTSGLLAVSKTTYGEARELKATRQMMIDLLMEIYNLSQQMNINIEADFVDKTVSFIDTFPHESTSSLTRDVWAGRPSEIDYQNGTVVHLAKKYGVDVPVNRFIYNCILPMELKARKTKK